MIKAFLPIARPRCRPVIEQLASLSHCLSGMVRIALHLKVQMVDTNGLFPVQSLSRETSGGSAEWGTIFLMRVVCWRAYGQAVHPIDDLMPSNIVMVIVTIVQLTCLATPFSCGVSGLVFS